MQLTNLLLVVLFAGIQQGSEATAPTHQEEHGVQMKAQAFRKLVALSLLAAPGHGGKLGDVWSDCSKAQNFTYNIHEWGGMNLKGKR